MSVYRHTCVNKYMRGAGAHHTHGFGKPKRKTCEYCGGGFIVSQGMYYVLPWRSDGMYDRSQAVGTYSYEKRAYASIPEDDETLVVRFLDD